MERPLSWTNFYAHPRFWRHAIPWFCFLAFLSITMLVFGEENEDSIKEESGVAIFGLLELFALIYASFYAYNRLYKKLNQKKLFGIVVLLIIVVIALFDHVMSVRIIQIGVVNGFWANMVIYPIVILVAFGLKLSYHGTKQLFVIERLQAKQTESELKLLKSQVNPHFLFNTLNNIYSTNLDDHEKANQIILELSDLLRYQLESNKSTFTSLQKEIQSLENYIHLEKIRVLDCQVIVNKDIAIEDANIVPLILIPFVENAFKYGTGIEAGDIKIDITLDKNKMFTFSIANKIVQKKGKVHSGGIGLENVKKRLNIMYSDKHELDISDKDQYFYVTLKMQL